MLPEKQKHREAAHIGEELFDDPSYELEQQCLSVQRGVEANLFSLETGLQAYQVSMEQYESYLGKNISKLLFDAFISKIRGSSPDVHYFNVINIMLDQYTKDNPKQDSKQIAPILRKLKKLSKNAENEVHNLNK